MFSNINSTSIIFSLITILLFCVLVFFNLRQKDSNFLKNYTYRYSNKLKYIALWFSILFLLVALFEPRWNELVWTKTAKKWEIIFLLDLTRSMDARDIDYFWRNISRLDYVKRLIDDVVTENKDFNYWIAWFAWEWKKFSPITSDNELIKILVSGLDYENILVEGVDFVDWVSKSVQLLKDGSWTIILFTDWGEDWDFEIPEIKNAIPKDIQLVTIWVWKPELSRIPIWINLFGEYIYKTYNWELVLTELNKDNIEELWAIWSHYYLEEGWVENVLADISENLEEKVVDDNLKQRKNISLPFLIISFVMFIMYIGVMSLEKKSLNKNRKKV